MATKVRSRWADNEEDDLLEDQRKREKEEKRRLKAEKQLKLDQAHRAKGEPNNAAQSTKDNSAPQEIAERPSKRRRLSPDLNEGANGALPLLRFPAPEWGPCRHVDNFEKLNHIEEGSYGWVSRAKDISTKEIVALKKLKMDNANDGFPVTGLREIQTLMESWHPNIVNLREVVIGDKMDE